MVSGAEGFAQGVKTGLGGVGAAGRRGDQRRPGAAAQVEVEVAEGDLGVIVEARHQLAGLGIGFDLHRLL